MSVQSRYLDEVYLHPAADFVGYRKVLIDPVRVALRPNWRRDQNESRDLSRRISVTDAAEIVQQATDVMARTVADVFAAKGYEIVTAPGPGVLRVTPSVVDLDIYEPDVTNSRLQALFTHDAGTATLRLELRDSAAGTLLGVVVDRGTATQIQADQPDQSDDESVLVRRHVQVVDGELHRGDPAGACPLNRIPRNSADPI